MTPLQHNRTAPALRVRVRLHAWRLDRELADGGGDLSSPQHALRARQLAHPHNARRLARAVRRAIARAERGRAPLDPSVPLTVDALRWREALLGVAERLGASPTPSPRGIARLQVLLSDGSSPLYNPAATRSVGEAIWWVADGLSLCPPHTWGCPVIIKLDPGHVGWTCARCGAIATSEDAAARPA